MKLNINIKEGNNLESTSALSDLQKEYRKFIRDRCKEWGIKSPFEGTEDDIVNFFSDVRKEWRKHKKDKGLVSEQELIKSVSSRLASPLSPFEVDTIRKAVREFMLRLSTDMDQMAKLKATLASKGIKNVPLIDKMEENLNETLKTARLITGI